ncbi:MAG: RNA 2',3'-cyclic phosphodiesterase [Patescibacteria group bacterium]|nr:RNA 2',3'-cyclic phosphodiesterase [Patescibacteria group bacterium]
MKLRLFIAFTLTSGLIKKIAFLEKELDKISGRNLDWIPLKNLHLTIIFLGYLDYQSYLKVAKIFDSFKLDQPLQLRITKVDYGPPENRRMLWLYGARNQYLEDIKKEFENKLSREGVDYKRENRLLIPHINLLRIKGGKDIGNIAKDLNWQVSLTEIALFQSQLSFSGATYEKLKSIRVS